MTVCVRCATDVSRWFCRDLCASCYAAFRRRNIAYGRWPKTETVSAVDARIHADILLGWGMLRPQIRRMSGLPKTTLDDFLATRPDMVYAATAEAILSVPIPKSNAEWIAAAVGRELVPTLGSRRRLRGLVAAGHPLILLAEELAVTKPAISRLLHRQQRVRAHRHHQIAALFSRLEVVPGPSDDARAYGKAQKWSLPFQWDPEQIDEPHGRTVQGARRFSKRVAA